MPSWKPAAIGWRMCCARRVCAVSTITPSSWRTTRATSRAAAPARAGLYYTCVNSFLTSDELAYILNNSESKVLITSAARRDVATAALASCPQIEFCLIADGAGDGGRVQNLDAAAAVCPATPIADESLGAAMLYSSGT